MTNDVYRASAGVLPGKVCFRILLLLTPVGPLAIWYAYHYARTGFVFGNPEFFRYNVQSTLHPLRIVLALLLRIWQTVGYLDLYVLTLACVIAMTFAPIRDAHGERPRIAMPVQFAFLAIAVVYIVSFIDRRRRRSGALHASHCPAGHSGLRLDYLAAFARLEGRDRSHRAGIHLGSFHKSALRILSRRQSCLSRLHSLAPETPNGFSSSDTRRPVCSPHGRLATS